VGAVIGSFLNVVIHRLPRHESLVSPPSRCPHCETPVKPYDNVPVVSWLVLRGRCRHCGAPISPRYPVVELLTALVFAAVVLVRGFDDDLVLELPFVAALIALAGIDLDHKLLPNRIVYPMAAYGVIATLLVDRGDLVEHLVAGAGAFTFLLVAALAYPRGMGMGDVKLAGAMGLYLGVAVIPALLTAFLTGSIVGIAMIAREGAAARKKAVPFGVFLAIGGIVGVLAGPELVDVYKTNFLD
jgi:leader peptidase (prepilin peptidase) / N-methyltransferase